jgi:uncharacterized protein (TIRG00374 family)
MKFFKKYSFVIGILLFVFILSRLNLGYYKTLIAGINLSGILAILAAILLLYLPILALSPYRWQRLMRRQGIYYSFWQTFLMYDASVYIGLFTPGRVGEVSRVFYLKKEHSVGRALVSIILDRLADVVFLLLFGYFSMFLFLDILKKEVLLFGVIISALLLLVILLWKSRLPKFFLKKAFYYFVPKKYQDLWKINFQDFFRDFKIYKSGDYVFLFFLTLVNWSVYYFVVYLFAREIGISQVPVLYFFSTLAVVSLTALLPISIMGLGTRDAVLLAMFSLFKVPAELTIAVSMFILFLTFFTSAIGLFCWLKKPFEI